MRSIKQANLRAEKKLVARMALGRIRAKKAGKHVDGPHHHGHDPLRHHEEATLATMLKMRIGGAIFYRIKQTLDERGIKPPYAEKWSESAVKQILLRELGRGRSPKEESVRRSTARFAYSSPC